MHASVPSKKQLIVILSAEDDPDDRMLIADAFGEIGLRDKVVFVEDGEELLDYLFQRGGYAGPGSAPRPSLVLLDLNMPRRDGREALQQIKAHPELRRIPVVVFSTSSDRDDILGSYDAGGNSFIVKPSDFNELVLIVKQLSEYWFTTVEIPAKLDG